MPRHCQNFTLIFAESSHSCYGVSTLKLFKRVLLSPLYSAQNEVHFIKIRWRVRPLRILKIDWAPWIERSREGAIIHHDLDILENRSYRRMRGLLPYLFVCSTRLHYARFIFNNFLKSSLFSSHSTFQTGIPIYKTYLRQKEVTTDTAAIMGCILFCVI
jgi:hypothetical protein